MPKRSPLTPIFEDTRRRGQASVGAMIGTRRPQVLAIGAALETDTAGTIGQKLLQFGAWAYSTGSGVNKPVTLFWPSTPVTGDVAVLFLARSNSAAFPTLTDFGAPAHSGDRGAVYTRLCDGSETVSGYNFSIGGSAACTCIIVLLKGLSGLTDVGFATQAAVSSPTDITYPTITPSAQPSIIFYVGVDSQPTTGTPVNPGGSNPTPLLLTDSGGTPPSPTNQPRMVIWRGFCTSTSALGNRTVAETGLSANFYHGMTFGVRNT